MKTATLKTARAGSDDYLELVRAFALRVLRDDEEHAAAVKVYIHLTGRGVKLSAGERQYAKALAHFIADYDQREFPLISSLSQPLERLKYVLAESGTSARDLMKILGVSQPLVSQILNGKRSLTAAHLQRLGERFKVSADYFL